MPCGDKGDKGGSSCRLQTKVVVVDVACAVVDAIVVAGAGVGVDTDVEIRFGRPGGGGKASSSTILSVFKSMIRYLYESCY
jgi:hypothetical protein